MIQTTKFFLTISLTFVFIQWAGVLNWKSETKTIIIPPDPPFPRIQNGLHINGRINQIGSIKQIYVINLPHRHDRRLLSIALLQTLNLEATIVPAFGRNSTAVATRINLTLQGKINQDELGCWASHMQIWNEMAHSSDNQSWTLVLEDDVDLELDFVRIVESFSNKLWTEPDMIYLGHCDNLSGELVDSGINNYTAHIARHPSCTHAYAIRQATAKKLMGLLAVPTRAIDDDIVELSKKGRLKIISIHPPIAIQHQLNMSAISDIDDQNGVFVAILKKKLNDLIRWIKGINIDERLRNSTLEHANLMTAQQLYDDVIMCPSPFCNQNKL